jgi:hypothetical protein
VIAVKNGRRQTSSYPPVRTRRERERERERESELPDEEGEVCSTGNCAYDSYDSYDEVEEANAIDDMFKILEGDW